MIVWRISNYASLDGKGGLRSAGRWHNKGVPLVYLAESPAAGMLEVLANLELGVDEMPSSYCLLEVECPEKVTFETLNPQKLADDWWQNLEWTRAAGDQWIASNESAILRVPSAIVPHSFNYLLNPRHPDAKWCKILAYKEYPFDKRLLAPKVGVVGESGPND